MLNRIMGLDKEASSKSKYMWYTMGTGVFALSTLIMTILISRIMGETRAGMFSTGLSIAQWLTTIAFYEIRTYQVTDVKCEYKFSTYLTLRVIMCIATFVACFGYAVFNGYEPYKFTVVILVCIYKTIEALADSFEGEFQKEDRIDMSGKSEFFRVSICMVVLSLSMLITNDLIASLVIMNVAAMAIVIVLDIMVARQRVSVNLQFQLKKLMKLTYVCTPLAISTFLSNYIINSSKLSVDRVLGDEAQLYYTAVFMPNMVINLFSGIIFKPMQTKMAVFYNDRKMKEFWGVILKMVVIITGFTLVCEIGAFLIGIPVLGWLYSVNLTKYKSTLLMLLLCGGVNAINIILYYVLAIMRKQKFMAVIYLIVCLAAMAYMDVITKARGLVGAAEGYLMAVILLCMLLLGYIYVPVGKERKHG